MFFMQGAALPSWNRKFAYGLHQVVANTKAAFQMRRDHSARVEAKKSGEIMPYGCLRKKPKSKTPIFDKLIESLLKVLNPREEHYEVPVALIQFLVDLQEILKPVKKSYASFEKLIVDEEYFPPTMIQEYISKAQISDPNLREFFQYLDQSIAKLNDEGGKTKEAKTLTARMKEAVDMFSNKDEWTELSKVGQGRKAQTGAKALYKLLSKLSVKAQYLFGHLLEI